MAAVFLRDENGKRIIDDKEAGALGFKSGAALTHIVERGVKLNRIDDETVDEAEKN